MLRLRLPDWSARRLFYEACFYYNLRHPDTLIDEEEAPWDRCVGAILAFLRHEHTDYEETLAGTFDPVKRDALVAEITTAAYAKYRWLRKDPRKKPEFDPPPEPEDEKKPLNRRAAKLAEMRTFAQAVQRFLDTDCPADRREEMEQKLHKLNRRIERDFDIFGPINDKMTRADFRRTRTGSDYDFFGHALFPNRWTAMSVTCPRCGQRVVRTKSPLNLGQGRRMHVLTCYCVTGMVVPPPPGKGSFIILTLEEWEHVLKVFAPEPAPTG